MNAPARLFRLVWGGDVDRALRPVLAVSLIGSIAGASAYPFLGIWAIKELHAPQSSLAFSYLTGAVLAGAMGYAGGHWSDRIGRRPLSSPAGGSRRWCRSRCSRSAVTVFQLRLTRWTGGIPAAIKLGVAMPLMGVPFLLLNVHGSAGVIALVIMLFVIGEMLWVPTSQAVVAALAPADIRGAYMGVFGGTWSVGWAATPFLGLQVRHAYGDATMWMCVATVGVIAGITGLLAARGHDGEAVGSLAT